MSQQNFTNHMELLEVQNGSFGTVTQVLLDEYLKRQLGKGFWYTALFLTSYFSYSIKTNVSINFVSPLQWSIYVLGATLEQYLVCGYFESQPNSFVFHFAK